jgi:hypothetical protein
VVLVRGEVVEGGDGRGERVVARRVFARSEGKEGEGVAAAVQNPSGDGRLGVGLVAEAEGEGEKASERGEEEVEEKRVNRSSGFEVVEVE